MSRTTANDFESRVGQFRPDLENLLTTFLTSEQDVTRTLEEMARQYNVPFLPTDDRISVTQIGGEKRRGACPTLYISFRQPTLLPSPERKRQGVKLAIGLAIGAMMADARAGAGWRVVFERVDEDGKAPAELPEALHGASAIYTLAFDSFISSQTIGIPRGAIRAAERSFSATVKAPGVGSHEPAYGNPIQITGHIITALGQLTTRRTDPLRPARIVTTSLLSENSADRCQSVTLTGKLQATYSADLENISRLLERTLVGITGGFDCTYELDFGEERASLQADPVLLAHLRAAATFLLGPAKVASIDFLNSSHSDILVRSWSSPCCVVSLADPAAHVENGISAAMQMLTTAETGTKSLTWLFL